MLVKKFCRQILSILAMTSLLNVFFKNYMHIKVLMGSLVAMAVEFYQKFLAMALEMVKGARAFTLLVCGVMITQEAVWEAIKVMLGARISKSGNLLLLRCVLYSPIDGLMWQKITACDKAALYLGFVWWFPKAVWVLVSNLLKTSLLI